MGSPVKLEKSKPLSGLHESARSFLSSRRLPNLKDEDYRFTPVANLDLLQECSLSEENLESPSSIFGGYAIESRAKLSVSNFEPHKAFQFLAWDQMETNLDSAFPPLAFKEDPFAWAALASDFSGFNLRVYEGQSLDLPIEHLLSLVAGQKVQRLRIHVHMERASKLRWMGRWGNQASDFSGTVFALQSFYLEERAQLEYTEIQDFPENSKHFIRQSFVLKEGAQADLFWAAKGSSFGQHRVHTDCAGAGSRIFGRRALKALECQHSDFWIENLHSSPEAESRTDQWAVVDDKAHSIFNAMIRIPPKMSGSRSAQKSRTLLLSKRAQAENMPKLIIETDDVQVSHGASVSSVDEDQIYYMQSRGIPREEARLMLIEGFLDDALSDMKSEDWKEWFQNQLKK